MLKKLSYLILLLLIIFHIYHVLAYAEITRVTADLPNETGSMLAKEKPVKSLANPKEIQFETSFTKISQGVIVDDGGISGGVSWADYDNDGLLDLFVTNAQDQVNFLYHNEGGGDFVKISSGIIVTEARRSAGNSWGDYDNDGDIDLFVSNQQQFDILYRNDGDGGFTKIEEGEIVSNPGDSHHCSWGDYNNDGNLDLFVANGGFTTSGNNYLYMGNSDASFSQITEGDIVDHADDTFGGNWADYDNDGDLDLFVAHFNYGDNFLYRNDGDGNFTEITEGDIVTDGGSSIGSSWGDYDNDGDLDLFVANWGYQNNFLYRNDGDDNFTRIEDGDIVNDGGDSWVGNWGDFDNDGDLDLFVTNYNQDNFLYANNGDSTFTKITDDIIADDGGLSSGSSWADYDNDGDLDLFVANWENQNNYFYENDGNDNNWINIKCLGIESNASAIGARVSLKTVIDGDPVWQMREIAANTGLRSQNSLNVEFGLGDASVIDSLVLKWPGGLVEVDTGIEANQFLTIEEGDLTAVEKGNHQADGSKKLILFQNFPNPFNPRTVIRFDLPEAGPVSLKVFDASGKLVKILIHDRFRQAGSHSETWDGTNSNGQNVSSGVYLYKLTNGSLSQTKRMAFVR